MTNKTKKSIALDFKENDEKIIEAAKAVLDDLDNLSSEARFMMEENPESKGNIALWNLLVDIEDAVTSLSEGMKISEKDIVTLGNNCVEAAQYFNRSEEITRADAIAVFAKLNDLVFRNDTFA